VQVLETTPAARPEDLSGALSVLGHAQLALKDPAAAARSFERAMTLREQALGPNHALVGVSAASVATALSYGTDSAGAERLYARALSILEQSLPARAEDFADVAARLASLQDDRNVAAAEATLLHALSQIDLRGERNELAIVRLAIELRALLERESRLADAAALLASTGLIERCVPAPCPVPKRVAPKPGKTPSEGAIANASRIVAGLRRGFKACYNAALQRQPRLRGHVRLAFSVESDGHVGLVRSQSLGVEPALDCVLAQAHAARFDAPAGGSGVVVVPITFVVKGRTTPRPLE
jgi:hypothetical protein